MLTLSSIFFSFDSSISFFLYSFSTLSPFRYSVNLITGNSLWVSDSDEDVVNVPDHSEVREERGERKKDKNLKENEEADATSISVHSIIGKKTKRSTKNGHGTKAKRKSFVKIEDETGGDYYQDVETGDTVWDVPANGEVVTSDEMHKLSASATKQKRKSFVKIEDETGSDYYQDVETGDTVWDVPSDSEVI